jgi:PBSX family phage terminase large subunit
MLLSRLRVPGAQLFATCNPEGPAHWLKKKFIDNKELDIISWNFGLDDNPSLDNAYKENIKKEYSGMWYKRYILGEWAAAHGLIYDNFTDDNIYEHPKNNPTYRVVGIDYGTTNPTAAVMLAITPNAWPQICVEQEYYYDASIKGRSKTDQELVQDIKDWIGWKPITTIYVDPAAASLKLALRHADLPVVDAKNDVLVGIKTVSKFISNLNLIIHKSCRTLTDQIQSYSWDPKAADRGEDRPLKNADHICDALRYACASAFPNGEIGRPDELISVEQLKRSIYGTGPNSDLYGGSSPWGGGF